MVFSLKVDVNILELAKNCLLSKQNETHIYLYLTVAILYGQKKVDGLELALQQYYQKPLKLQVTRAQVSSAYLQQTPAKLKEVAIQQQQQVCLESLQNMPLFKALSRCFAVKIDTHTLKLPNLE